MDVIIDEVKAFPELKTFTLVNNYTGEERVVTKKQLITAFGNDGFTAIKAGRNDYWTLIEN